MTPTPENFGGAPPNDEWLKSQCNRYVNGFCSTRACMVRGGYKPGITVDYECATCEPHEILIELQNLRAQTAAPAMVPCPSCYGSGQWEGECCNGSGGCTCRGQRVPMGRCNVCHGNGEVRADGVGVNPGANAEAIRGLCYLGSGPRR